MFPLSCDKKSCDLGQATKTFGAATASYVKWGLRGNAHELLHGECAGQNVAVIINVAGRLCVSLGAEMGGRVLCSANDKSSSRDHQGMRSASQRWWEYV